MDLATHVHGAERVQLARHCMSKGTEWATIQISGSQGVINLTVYERGAIDDALHLPRSADFYTNIPEQEAA